MSVDGKALTVTGMGVLFLWSGIRGWSVMATIGDVVTGRAPTPSTSIPLSIPGGTGGQAGGGSVPAGSDALAVEAVKYVGHAYRFGGSPGVDGSRPWDCSSFVNWVASVRLGRSIPGYGPGRYRGTAHGPTTGQWAVWPGLKRVSRSQVQAGDVIVWAGHMGIATSNNTMVSAENPRKGTRETPIDGYGNGPLVKCGRYP